MRRHRNETFELERGLDQTAALLTARYRFGSTRSLIPVAIRGMLCEEPVGARHAIALCLQLAAVVCLYPIPPIVRLGVHVRAIQLIDDVHCVTQYPMEVAEGMKEFLPQSVGRTPRSSAAPVCDRPNLSGEDSKLLSIPLSFSHWDPLLFRHIRTSALCEAMREPGTISRLAERERRAFLPSCLSGCYRYERGTYHYHHLFVMGSRLTSLCTMKRVTLEAITILCSFPWSRITTARILSLNDEVWASLRRRRNVDPFRFIPILGPNDCLFACSIPTKLKAGCP